jgi:sugar diacid utilization regulator
VSATGEPNAEAVAGPTLDAFAEVSEAVESGAGLPSLTRAAAHALDASAIVLDAAGIVVASACGSPEDKRAVLAGEGATEASALRVADEVVGELRLRPRAAAPDGALLRMVTTLIAQEVGRARAPERASEAAVGDFLSDLFARRLTDRDNVLARASELGCALRDGASVIVVRARPHAPVEGDWRARLLTVARRGARGVERDTLAAAVDLGPRPEPELVLLVPGQGAEAGRRAAAAVLEEVETGLEGFAVVVALSRPAADPVDLHRAGSEALLAANVAEGRGDALLGFEDTGAYRLLLPAMSDDAAELRSFYDETVATVAAYDTQYETELLRTLDTFLEGDGNVARTAERLFTHRHTIRYRLDRVRELSGLDVGSTEGRERLSLGLKAMRVLGIVPPGGPAHEAGTEGGRVPGGKER